MCAVCRDLSGDGAKHKKWPEKHRCGAELRAVFCDRRTRRHSVRSRCFYERCRIVLCGRCCATVARRYLLYVFRPTVPHGCVRYGSLPQCTFSATWAVSSRQWHRTLVCGVVRCSATVACRHRPSAASHVSVLSYRTIAGQASIWFFTIIHVLVKA